jgi:antitoxin CptB
MRKQNSETKDSGFGIHDSEKQWCGDAHGAVEVARALPPESRIPNPESLRRMQWRCRRGLLELDIFLQPFVSQRYASLSAAELVAFEALLDLPDNTLWDMMSGRQNNDDPAQSALLEKIKSV